MADAIFVTCQEPIIIGSELMIYIFFCSPTANHNCYLLSGPVWVWRLLALSPASLWGSPCRLASRLLTPWCPLAVVSVSWSLEIVRPERLPLPLIPSLTRSVSTTAQRRRRSCTASTLPSARRGPLSPRSWRGSLMLVRLGLLTWELLTSHSAIL